MGKKTYTFSRVAGFNRALRDIPKEAGPELRAAAMEIAGDIARQASARALSLGGVARYVAPTIKAGRDRVPVVRMGGNTRLPARDGRPRTGAKQTVGNVIWGAEWGSNRYRQFPAPVKAGRMLWSTVRDNYESAMDAYGDALMAAVDKAAR